MGKIRNFGVISLFFFMISIQSKAAEINNSKLLEDSLTDMYTVAGSGLGGAIIGLSTLSFVEEPGDHLKNILVGAALGIMGGVAFVGYSTANRGRDLYYEGAQMQDHQKGFSTNKRVAWHKNEVSKLNYSKKNELPFFVWSSKF